ncbi:MAG: hypothetical protein KF726_16905 [Anaerolineae bacterium]|nr:hypothetical protein [Anaerolineae bacterium]
MALPYTVANAIDYDKLIESYIYYARHEMKYRNIVRCLPLIACILVVVSGCGAGTPEFPARPELRGRLLIEDGTGFGYYEITLDKDLTPKRVVNGSNDQAVKTLNEVPTVTYIPTFIPALKQHIGRDYNLGAWYLYTDRNTGKSVPIKDAMTGVPITGEIFQNGACDVMPAPDGRHFTLQTLDGLYIIDETGKATDVLERRSNLLSNADSAFVRTARLVTTFSCPHWITSNAFVFSHFEGILPSSITVADPGPGIASTLAIHEALDTTSLAMISATGLQLRDMPFGYDTVAHSPNDAYIVEKIPAEQDYAVYIRRSDNLLSGDPAVHDLLPQCVKASWCDYQFSPDSTKLIYRTDKDLWHLWDVQKRVEVKTVQTDRSQGENKNLAGGIIWSPSGDAVAYCFFAGPMQPKIFFILLNSGDLIELPYQDNSTTTRLAFWLN